MDEYLIEKWNKKVTNADTVYILGDLMFRNEKPPEEYLRQLRGKKHLIIGNHDREWIKKCDLSAWFESTNNLLYTTDGNHTLTVAVKDIENYLTSSLFQVANAEEWRRLQAAFQSELDNRESQKGACP